MYCTWKNKKCKKSRTIISTLKNRLIVPKIHLEENKRLSAMLFTLERNESSRKEGLLWFLIVLCTFFPSFILFVCWMADSVLSFNFVSVLARQRHQCSLVAILLLQRTAKPQVARFLVCGKNQVLSQKLCSMRTEKNLANPLRIYIDSRKLCYCISTYSFQL